jgi:hypothetical protein
MFRRLFSPPTDDAPGTDDGASGAGRTPAAGEPDLATLPIVGITRRRMGVIMGCLLAAWIVVLFARQVSDASAATGKAEAMVAANAARQAEVDALDGELATIGQQAFILQQARGYGLGTPKEVPFSLAAGAPALPSDAPGSAGLRVGAPTSVSPLERWLTLLFGPSD